MDIPIWRRKPPAPGSRLAGTSFLATRVHQRAFLKMLLAAASGAGLGQLARGSLSAEAAPLLPSPGALAPLGTDQLVEGNLAVTGNTTISTNSTVGQSMALGGLSPHGQGTVDAREGIYVGGQLVVGSDGRGRKCFYADSPPGIWRRVGAYTWSALSAMAWEQVRTL